MPLHSLGRWPRRLNRGVAYDTSFYKSQSQTSFALPNGDIWRLSAGVQHAVRPKGDLGFAVEYARSQSSSDPSALIRGRYDHPTMFFMSVIYSHRFERECRKSSSAVRGPQHCVDFLMIYVNTAGHPTGRLRTVGIRSLPGEMKI